MKVMSSVEVRFYTSLLNIMMKIDSHNFLWLTFLFQFYNNKEKGNNEKRIYQV